MILVLLLLQLLLGMGLARRLGTFSGVQLPALGFLLGLPAFSIVVFLLDVFGIPLTFSFILLALALSVIATDTQWIQSSTWVRFSKIQTPKVALYELPAILIVVFFCLMSLWRTVLLPVTPRDALVGMDLVAKYAVLEGTINSSVFTSGLLEGQLSNQPYYAPFVALMQTVFRFAGMASGKLWIAVLYSSFAVFLYTRLKGWVHPLLAGFLVVVLLSTQNVFIYSFLVLTDLANAIFFCLCALFAFEYSRSPNRKTLLLSAIFLGFACWTRTETVLLVPLGAALVWIGGRGSRNRVKDVVIFVAIPVVLFLAWHWIYFTFYFGSAPESRFLTSGITGQAVLRSLRQMVNLTFVSKLCGTLPFLFLPVLVVDAFVLRKRDGWEFLVWILGIILMLLFVVQAFPAASMEYTGKRGFIKVLMVMMLYLAASPTTALLSHKLQQWEGRGKTGVDDGD